MLYREFPVFVKFRQENTEEFLMQDESQLNSISPSEKRGKKGKTYLQQMIGFEVCLVVPAESSSHITNEDD